MSIIYRFFKKYFLFIGIVLIVIVLAFSLYFLKIDKNVASAIGSLALLFILIFLTSVFIRNSREELKKTVTAEAREKTALIMALEEAKSKLKKYTFLKLNKQLISSIRQYLVFFSNYVNDSKKVDITMHASEVEGGLDIGFDFPETTTKEELQTWLDEYLGFLTADIDNLQVNVVEEVTNSETDFLILDLKSQIRHLIRSLKSAELRHDDLKIEHDFLKDFSMLMMSKSGQLFNNTHIEKQINNTAKAQFIGNKIENSKINISEIDDKIVKLIKDLSKNNKQEKKLLAQIETLKSETSTDKEKEKSGSLLRKFLETCNSETAKEIIKTIAEKGEGWVQYITGIF